MLLHHSQITKIIEALDITEGRTIFVAEEDVVFNVEKIGEVAVEVGVPVIWQITVGHMEFVPNQALNSGPRKNSTIRTQCGATIFQGENATAPARLGRYLRVSLM